jgi:hypothetical protein
MTQRARHHIAYRIAWLCIAALALWVVPLRIAELMHIHARHNAHTLAQEHTHASDR